MIRSRTCGRHQRLRRRLAIAPLPLFDWAARRATALRSTGPAARIVLLDTCRDAEGQPRPALLTPGRRNPTVFPTITAALAELRRMEASR